MTQVDIGQPTAVHRQGERACVGDQLVTTEVGRDEITAAQSRRHDTGVGDVFAALDGE